MENLDKNAKNWHSENKNKMSRIKLKLYFEGKKIKLGSVGSICARRNSGNGQMQAGVVSEDQAATDISQMKVYLKNDHFV